MFNSMKPDYNRDKKRDLTDEQIYCAWKIGVRKYGTYLLSLKQLQKIYDTFFYKTGKGIKTVIRRVPVYDESSQSSEVY